MQGLQDLHGQYRSGRAVHDLPFPRPSDVRGFENTHCARCSCGQGYRGGLHRAVHRPRESGSCRRRHRLLGEYRHHRSSGLRSRLPGHRAGDPRLREIRYEDSPNGRVRLQGALQAPSDGGQPGASPVAGDGEPDRRYGEGYHCPSEAHRPERAYVLPQYRYGRRRQPFRRGGGDSAGQLCLHRPLRQPQFGTEGVEILEVGVRQADGRGQRLSYGRCNAGLHYRYGRFAGLCRVQPQGDRSLGVGGACARQRQKGCHCGADLHHAQLHRLRFEDASQRCRSRSRGSATRHTLQYARWSDHLPRQGQRGVELFGPSWCRSFDVACRGQGAY